MGWPVRNRLQSADIYALASMPIYGLAVRNTS